MTGHRVSSALARIEAAAARIAAAAAGRSTSGGSADGALAAKHEALREAVSQSLQELDSLIGSGAR